MKRVLFSMVLLMVAGMTFAQVSKVKEAKSLAEGAKPDFEKAQQLINEALTNPETKDDANTWNVAGLIQKKINEKEMEKAFLKQPFDTAAYYNSIYHMFEYFLKCDELAQRPDEKGKVKNKFRKSNAAIMVSERKTLAEGGANFFNGGDTKDAFNLMAMYVDAAYAPMLEKENLAVQDTLLGMYAYYAALAAQQNKDYSNAVKYSKYANNDAEYGKSSIELCAEAYKAQQDTVQWLETVKEGMQKYPEHIYFIVSLVDHYTQLDQLGEAQKVADEFVAQKPNDPQALYIQGYIYTLIKNYDGAHNSLKKAIQLDGQNANYQAWLGHSYFYEAQDVIKATESMDMNSPEYQTQQDKIRSLYKEAMPYYEKARTLSPDERNLWQNLYTIYYALNMGAELEDIEKALGL